MSSIERQLLVLIGWNWYCGGGGVRRGVTRRRLDIREGLDKRVIQVWVF